MTLKPGLYIVSTPIGNLDDITIRAVRTLQDSDLILCEDTRISRKLLTKHHITAKVQIYNDHSDEQQRAWVKQLIDDNQVVSLISDAGTPLIADPGYKLVQDLFKHGYHCEVIPGVSSPIAALTISGLASDRFLFAGFLPKTTAGRKRIFEELGKIRATLIFFETANRLGASLMTALEVLGNRQACVARELTKLYQNHQTDYLDKISQFYQANLPRGEIVLLISGYKIKDDQQLNSYENLQQVLGQYLIAGLTAKSATELAHQQFGSAHTKKAIYLLANLMRDQL